MYHKERFFSKDNHLNDDAISIILDELRSIRTIKLPKEIDDHLDECQICKDIIMDLYFPSMTVCSSDEPKSKKVSEQFLINTSEKPTRRKQFIVRTAASLILIAFLSFIYLETTSDRHINNRRSINLNTKISHDHNLNIKKVKSDKVNRTTNKSIDKFSNNPNLESMVDSTERGLLTGDNSYRALKIPEDGIIFRWKNIPSKELSLIIVDNTNTTLFRFKIEGEKFELNKRLTPGLYYWKLSDRSNLYYVGKFYIKGESTSQTE